MEDLDTQVTNNQCLSQTLVINLFGGQGTGKSTMMAWIFAKLKSLGYECEMCPEFAKELVWEGRLETFSDELYLFAKQNHRLHRLNGKVDIVITDRPLYMSIPYYRYYKGNNKIYEDLVKQTFDSYNNLNIFLERVKPYVQNGRRESELEAKNFDVQILDSLKNGNYKYLKFKAEDASLDKIINEIIKEYGYFKSYH